MDIWGQLFRQHKEAEKKILKKKKYARPKS